EWKRTSLNLRNRPGRLCGQGWTSVASSQLSVVSSQHSAFSTQAFSTNRWLVVRVTCAGARCEQPGCRWVSAAGKTGRACRAPCGASRGECPHTTGLTQDCRQASGNKPQARRGNGRPGPCPRCGGCNRRCSASRPRHGAKNEKLARLAPRRGKLQRLPDTCKCVAPDNPAGVAFVNGRPQRGQLRLVLLFFALQNPQRRAHHLAGVFVTSALDLGEHEAVKLLGQIDVAGRHVAAPFEWV